MTKQTQAAQAQPDRKNRLKVVKKYSLDIKAIKARLDTDFQGIGTALLQHQLGNRAVQRALVQLQDAPRAGFNPLDPAVIGAAARGVIAENEAPVRYWLTTNTNRLRLLTMDEFVVQVRRNISQASRLADVEIQGLVRDWAAAQNITIPVIPVAGPAKPSIQIPDAVKKAFSIPIDGVNLVNLPGGRLNISASGATARLSRGDIHLSWGGSLGIDIPMEGFQLAGKLDKNRWEITLATPGASSVPDLSKLAEVFQKAETALRGMIATTAGFSKLNNVSEITAAVSPHVGPLKEAVQTLVDLSDMPSVSAGISLSAPMRGSETPGGSAGGSSTGGITLTASVTIRF